MRGFFRSLAVATVAVTAAIALAVGSTVTTAVTLTATTALIMGGTGRPNPDDFPGYVPNIAEYYLYPNSTCQPTGEPCELEAVFTPETAWPVYGGLSAPTWKNSILQGVDLFDAAVQEQLQTLGPDDRLVLFGYSQSGAILAYEKETLNTLSPEEKSLIEFVVIGNVSRPGGGLNSRAFPFSIPIVEFPFGPPMPTDSGIKTTDIAMKWDIIADAPLYITNPVAMLNALLGFEYVHGTYPDPTEADPTDTPGGYTVEQWQWMMDYPELYPELVDVQEYGDSTYITVTPTVLPLVQPLHGIGLSALANLLEPALRVLIEQTGYDRSLPYGQDTPFRFLPIFNPLTLALGLAEAIPKGVQQMMAGLNGEPTFIVPAPPETLLPDTAESETVQSEPVASSARVAVTTTETAEPAVTENNTASLNQAAAVNSDEVSSAATDEDADRTSPLRAVKDDERKAADSSSRALQPRSSANDNDNDDHESDTAGTSDKSDDSAGAKGTAGQGPSSDSNAA